MTINARGLAAELSRATGGEVKWSHLKDDGATTWNFKFTDAEADEIRARFTSARGAGTQIRNPRRGFRG